MEMRCALFIAIWCAIVILILTHKHTVDVRRPDILLLHGPGTWNWILHREYMTVRNAIPPWVVLYNDYIRLKTKYNHFTNIGKSESDSG